jgi:hypothetical protein
MQNAVFPMVDILGLATALCAAITIIKNVFDSPARKYTSPLTSPSTHESPIRINALLSYDKMIKKDSLKIKNGSVVVGRRF